MVLQIRFQLTKEEYQNLRCQTGISSFVQDENNYGGRRTLPYVFTEQGISIFGIQSSGDSC